MSEEIQKRLNAKIVSFTKFSYSEVQRMYLYIKYFSEAVGSPLFADLFENLEPSVEDKEYIQNMKAYYKHSDKENQLLMIESFLSQLQAIDEAIEWKETLD